MRGDQRLCACGSGLRAARCCEMREDALPAPGSGGPLTPLVERALGLMQQNAIAEARQLCLGVLELAPGHPDALAVLYQICRDHGPPAAAEALLRRMVALHPNTFWAVNDLAVLTLNKGAVFETELHARNAIRIAPENPQSHNLMGIALTESNRPHTLSAHPRTGQVSATAAIRTFSAEEWQVPQSSTAGVWRLSAPAALPTRRPSAAAAT